MSEKTKSPTTKQYGIHYLQYIDNDNNNCTLWLTNTNTHTLNFRKAAVFNSREKALEKATELNSASYNIWPVKSISGLIEHHITKNSLQQLRPKEKVVKP